MRFVRQDISSYFVNIDWDPNNARSVLMTWFNKKVWWWPYRGRNA